MADLKDPRLVLTPVENNPLNYPPRLSLVQLEQFLKDCEFIGNQSTSPQGYEIGENFLHQISFLGCSPTLSGDNNVYISLIESDEILFFNSSDIPPPRCPACNKTDTNWSQYLQQWQLNKQSLIHCPQCQQDYSFTTMKWKKNGGFGSLIIAIHGVQEQLAVPNPQFIEQLEQHTETRWEYFFAE